MAQKVLMIVGHPYWQYSVGNKAIVEEYSRLNPDVVIDNLGVEYPDFKIDVESEKRKITEADIIVLQFPMMWYSAPSILHRWFEEVLMFGFAYGTDGDKLVGKKLVLSITAGTAEEAYTFGGLQTFPFDYFLPEFVAMANRCGLQYKGEVHTCGVNSAKALQDPSVAAEIRQEGAKQAAALDQLIKKIG